LNCHVQFVSRFGDAAFFGHDPKVVEVLVIECGSHDQYFKDDR
jgi:hypothetical protein